MSVDRPSVNVTYEKERHCNGITLKLYDDTKQSSEGRQCCAGQDILDAKRVSEKININHKILFYQKKFKAEVIDSFMIVIPLEKLQFHVFNVIKL